MEKEKSLVAVPKSQSLFFDVARFEHAQRVANMFSQSDMVPPHFRGNVANCVIAFNYAERIGVDPFMVMQNIYVVQGKPGIEGKLVIALVNNCGRFEPIQFRESGNLTKPENNRDGCIAYAKDIKSGIELESPMVDWRMVKAEGWYEKKGSKWKTIAPLMFRYRAATYFARTYCPEVFLGLQTKDELMDSIDLHQTSSGDYAIKNNEQYQKASDFDAEIERITGNRPDKAMEMFIDKLAQSMDLVCQEVKQQIAAENDYDQFLAHFEKFKAEQAAAAASNHVEKQEVTKSTVKTGSEDLGDLSDPTAHDKWRKLKRGTPAKGTGFAAYVKKHEASFIAAYQEWGQDLRNEFLEKHQSFYGMPPAFIAAEQPEDEQQSQGADETTGDEQAQTDETTGQDDPDMETMDRFNEIFTEKRGTPAWHYAQGIVTGDEKNSFRPQQEHIKTWLTYYDEYEKNQGGGF